MTEVVPRPASTVLLLRDSRVGLQVFMVVRHDAIDFASGALVFPGGRVDEDDHLLARRADVYATEDDLDGVARSLRVAAIRETFEECGVLLARSRGSDQLVSAARFLEIERAQRVKLCAGEIGLGAVLDAEALALATDLLVPFAHWITPRHQRKRYDTHFFLTAAPADQVAAHDGSESVDSIWITPHEAVAGQESGRFKLVFPTFLNLRKLGRFATVAAALAAARQARVVTVMPELLRHDESGMRHMRLPIEADYGGEIFSVDLPSAS